MIGQDVKTYYFMICRHSSVLISNFVSAKCGKAKYVVAKNTLRSS